MNFNISPYYDDFDQTKQFYKVLFRPGVAVQTREVNQLQSILQDQISKFGDHVFKEGSMVIPGEVSYNDKLRYVKIANTALGVSTIADLEGLEISDTTDGSGIKAQVIKAIAASGADPITLVVLYTQAAQNISGATGREFAANSTLYVLDDITKTLTVGNGVVSGRSAVAAVQAGVYYLGGYFVTIPSYTLSVKKYADTLTDINARIGLKYTEQIVTSDDDDSLYDNAIGSPNYAAPGANRFKIATDFIQVGLDENPENFFELLRIEGGIVQSIINASQYNILEETLARRTFDESGNYVVDDFKFDVRESRTNIRGLWANGQSYLVDDVVTASGGKTFVCIQAGTSSGSEPSQFNLATIDESTVVTDASVRWRYVKTPISNRGKDLNGDSNNLVATFGIGKAYVNGYEISKVANTSIDIPKARDTAALNNQSVNLAMGNYVYVDRRFVAGVPDISSGPQVQLFDRFYFKGSGNKFGTGNQVGTARINWVEVDGRGFYKLGLSDIAMNPDKGFNRDVHSIVAPDPTTSVAVTSYTLTGLIKYAGASTSSFLQIGGTMGTSAQSTTLMTVTGTGTAFLLELQVGDLLTWGTSSYGPTASWTVVGISSNTVLTVSGPALAANATTSLFVRLPAQTVFGVQTSTATVPTRFQSEFRVGDRVWLGTPTGSSTLTSMSVVRIINESRMLVSSAAASMIANTSIGVFYTGRSGLFAADIGGSFAAGVNARRLTGNFSISDYSGGTTLVQAHAAVRINGSNDARMLTELGTNDFVDINGNRIFITKISSNTVAYGICPENTITGATSTFPAFRIDNGLNDTQNTVLLFPLAPSAVSSTVDNAYAVYKTQSVSGLSGLSSVTVTLAAASGNNAAEALATTDATAFYVAQDGVATLSAPLTVISVVQVGNNVTLTLNSTFTANTARVIYPVARASAANNVLGGLRTKTLTFNQTDDFLSSTVATKTTLTLSNSDVYRLVKVYMATSFVGAWDSTVQANASDITSRYDLDNGQRDQYYDVGRLNLKPGFSAPTGSVRVVYDYFVHGTGDFFTRESYNPLQVPYENIPTYKTFRLGDVVDFRSRINPATGLLVNAAPPRFGTNFVSDVSYFLGRKDKILLNRSGVFYKVSGVSSLRPELPKTASENSIELYDLQLRPFTLTSEVPDVIKKKYDNRRYTMKDIGALDQRITSLEETTALSLLETKTQNLQVRDNRDSTLERYKTGFFVDNFGDDSNAEQDGDARFSIDFENRTLNCQVKHNSFPLVEKLNYTASLFTSSELVNAELNRAAENYKVTGDLLTLNYTTATMVVQSLATTSISVTPFVRATFYGVLRVVPDKDIYEDVHNKTAIIQVVDNQTAEKLQEEIARFRQTNRGAYRVEAVSVNTYVNTTKTSFLIPFARPNTILLKATGMKPNTKLYPYFDDVDVAEFCEGAIRLTFDSMPILETDSPRPDVKKEYPRWRSLNESADVQEITRAYKVRVRRRRWAWRYDYGLFRRQFNPKNVGNNLPSAAYRDAFRVALSMGASVYYYEGGKVVGSAVAVHQEGTTLYMVNGRGKLAPGFLRSAGTYTYNGTFYVSVDGNDPKFLPTKTVTAAQALTSDANGYLYTNSNGVAIGIFDLPETDTVKFVTGTKAVVLTDHPDNDPDDWFTRADGTYYVEGYDVTFTKNYITTKSYRLRPVPRRDPLAQSFHLPDTFTNGCFVTDIDVYFQSKPLASQIPVLFELRACDSTGRPEPDPIPGSEVVLYPDEVTVDATKGLIPTKFTFNQPIYLMPSKTYCFVLKSDSDRWRAWIATLGQPDVADPTKSYQTQAVLGSLFKSQDATLWTEDQLSDMKFRVNRAVFSTVDTGARFHVVNRNLPNQVLPSNPLTFVHGSNRIRVAHKDHGYSTGDTTRLYSAYWAGQFATLGAGAVINGIPVGEIFGSYVSSDVTTFRETNGDPVLTVSDVDFDTYTVIVSSIAIIAGGTTGITNVVGGGDDIIGQRNVAYHVVQPSVSLLRFEPTTISFEGRMTQGVTLDANANTFTGPYTTFTRTLSLNDYNILDTSSVILTDTNELTRITATSIDAGTPGSPQSWRDSFIGIVRMASSSDHVSPALDLSTFQLKTMQHRIDNPTRSTRLPVPLPALGSTSNLLLITPIVVGSTTIGFDGSNNRILSTTDNAFIDVVPGRYITVSGSSITANNNTSTGFLVTSVNPDFRSITVSGTLTTVTPGDTISIYQYDDFTEETTTVDATGESKYITNVVNLKNPATQLKLIIEACVPAVADFDVYYKIGAAGADFDNIVWTKYAPPLQTGGATSSYVSIVKSDVRGNFTDIEFDISTYDASGNPIDLTAFTAFQLKLVMRSSNAARIPQFRNMRAIAHA